MKPPIFSQDAGALVASAIRRLHSIINDPEIISFAGGMPNPATFPAEALAEAARQAILSRTAVTLQYGATAGLRSLREQTAARLRDRGVAKASADTLIVTTGSQQALDLLARVLVDPGDIVAVENPTYIGGLAAFLSRRADFAAAARDAERVDVEELKSTVARLRRGGRTVRVLYTIPNFQNPSGSTLSLAGRRELLAAADELDLLVIEDDPYAEIFFDAPPPPPLAALDGQARVVHLGSYSKTLSAGLRCGFLHARREILAKVELAKQAADLCSSTLDQMTLSIYLEANDYDAHLRHVRSFYASQKSVLLESLRRDVSPDVEISDSAGGLFVWLRLPERQDAGAILERALAQEKVAFVPGKPFFVGEDPSFSRYLRMTFAKETPERIEEGVRRLARVLEQAGVR